MERLEIAAAWAAVADPQPGSVVSRAATADSILAKLNPDRRVVQFSPLRNGDLNALVTWCLDQSTDTTESGAAAGSGVLRLVHGPAGDGKTRLLVEAAEALTDGGWVCGWLRNVPGAAQAAVGAAARLGRPVLLLVDDADTRTDLAELLTAAAGSGRKLRVVLAAREFGSWWQRLLADLDSRTTHALMPVWRSGLHWLDSTAHDRQQRFALAVRILAADEGKPVPVVELAPQPGPVPVLLLQAAGAAAVVHGLTGRVEVDEALQLLFVDEEARWKDQATAYGLADLSLDVLRGAVVFAVLAGADSLDGAADLLGAVPGCPPGRGEFANFVRGLHPQTAGRWLDPHLPGLLVQRYAANRLVTDSALLAALAGAIVHGPAQRADRVLTSLAASAAHTPAGARAMAALLARKPADLLLPALTVAQSGAGPLDEPIAQAVISAANSISDEYLDALWAAVPEHTSALALTAATLAQTRTERSTDDETRALRLSQLGVRLGDLGRHEDALKATSEAVALWRRLAVARPDDYERDLAGTLIGLGIRLGDLGRREEALDATSEALTFWRRLAVAHPDAHEPALAGTLGNLGNRLGDLGRREEALDATSEALTFWRRLAVAHPDAHEPDLARTLDNLGIRLGGLGRYEEALDATSEALTFWRRLAAAHPDAHEPDLARTLDNLGIHLGNLSRHEEAEIARLEAAAISRHRATIGQPGG